MRIAIVGAGAIGGYLGARLASSGQQVTFIARNRNLQALRERGIRLVLEDGSEIASREVRAVEQMAEAGPQDAVLLTVKAHQVGELLPQLRDLFDANTLLVTMINGVPWWYFQRHGGPHEGRTLHSVDPGGRIAAAIEPERIIGSVVYPAAELLEPGVVRLIEGNRFSLGELDGTRSPRIEALAQALMQAGFKAPVSRDIRGEIWVKLLGNATFNPLSALTHATLAQICGDGPMRSLVAQLMAEAQAVAAALGVVMKVSIEQRIAGAQAVGEHKTSMLQDVEQGRAPELAALLGAVVELGQVAGVATPLLQALHSITALLASRLAQTHGRLRIEPAG